LSGDEGVSAAAGLKRFGLFTLTMLVVGNSIGAGVYTTSGYVLADVGSREWVMLAWAVGGLIALSGAVSYGMLAKRLTESGGEYLYLSRSLHPLAGMIVGWISLIAGFTGAIAFAAIAFEAYAHAAHPVLANMPGKSLAIGAIIFAGLIHIIRARLGAAIHDVIVGIMLLALISFCAVALGMLIVGQWQPASAQGFDNPFRLSVFASSLVWISLSYAGFNAAVYVAGEAIYPLRNVPKAMILGTILTIVLYLGLNAVFLYAPDPSLIAGKTEIAAIASEALGGLMVRRMVEAIIALSLLTSITAMVLAGPRVYAKMSEDGYLPGFFAMTGSSPPRASIILQIALACIVVMIANLQGLLGYLGFTLSLSTALAVSTVFVRHIKLGERPRSVSYPLVPAFFILATLLFAVLSAIREPIQLYAAIGTVLVGVCAFLLAK